MYTDLQPAIDAAAYGDTILLRAGQTFTGHYTLRLKSGSGTIVIRSDASDANLPGAGARLVPSDRGGPTARTLLARLIGRGGAYKSVPLLRTEPGAHGYVIRFVEFDGVSHVGYETLLQLGTDTTAVAPYDITLDRVYIHGDRYKGQKRGISLNGSRLSLLNSYISDIKAVNADSQAINAYNGAGPFTIDNNYLEAAGENILFGGSDPAVSNLVPSDITIRRNHIFKPLAWRNAILAPPTGVRAAAGGSGSLAAGTHYFRVVALMATGTRTAISAPSAEVYASGAGGAITVSWSRVTGAEKYRVYRGTASGKQTLYRETTATSLAYSSTGELSGTPATAGTKWVVKNSVELKNARRVHLEANLIENCWSAGQYGYAIVLTPRNSGSAPWTRVQDVTFLNNIVRSVAGVVNIAGYDDSDPTLRTERITFRNNLFHDVSHTKYGTNAKAMLVGYGAAYLTFAENTIIHTNTSVLYAYGEQQMPGLVYTNNISQHHAYGIMGQSSSVGSATLAKFFPSAVVRCNVLAGGKASLYPTPNGFPTTTEWWASFVNPAGGDYKLKTGSPVALAGCGGVPPGADLVKLSAAFGTVTTAPTLSASQPVAAAPVTNMTPTADAGGPYTAMVGALVSVDGTGSSDPDGSVLNYRWHWGDEVLVRAADLPSSALRGSEWVRSAAADAAGGAVILNPDKGAAKRTTALAAPASYVEFTVNAAAGVPYYLWMRLRASSDRYTNDSLHLQFGGASDAVGNALARIGTTASIALVLEDGTNAGIAGWGWSDRGWGTAGAPIYFSRGGAQTIRIQAREDGVMWDQLVLSSAIYKSSPGALKRDNTFVAEDFGTSFGVSAPHRYARTGVYPVVLVVTDPPGAVGSDGSTVTVR